MLVNFSEFLDRSSILSTPFKGVVVDNNDPLKLRRVKCSIEGLCEGDTTDLPWITCKADSFMGGASGFASHAVPQIGSELIIEFPFDEIYSAQYTGFWPSSTNVNAEFNSDYPNKVGFVVGGFKMTYVKDGDFVIEHPSGAKLNIKADGTINIESTAPVEVKGNEVNVTAESVVNIEAATEVNVDAEFVNLAGGTFPVARVNDTAEGIGNLGGLVVSYITKGSDKVFAG